jgi:glycosyltransferase involved in cell wall biosynthesis
METAKTNPLVSIIIPAFNLVSYIGQAVESALNQTYRPTETIVIDDGSTDGTSSVLQKYSDRVRVVFQRNGGAGAARNRGIAEATGEYVAFLDGDDAWFPDKLEKQLAMFVRYKDVHLVSGMAECVDESGVEMDVDLNYHGNVYDRPLRLYDELLQKGNPIWTSSVVVRKAAIEEAGFFDEGKRRSQDYDMWIRLAEKNDFYVMGEKLGRYRWISSSLTHRSIGREYEAQLDILRKHEWRFEHAAYRRRLARVYSAWAESEACYGSLKQGVRMTLRSLRLNPFVVRPYVQMMAAFIKSPFRRLLGQDRGLYQAEPQ